MEIISYFYLTSVAFLLSVFSNGATWGIVFSFLLHVLWYGLFSSSISLPFTVILSNYWWAIIAWSIVGFSLSSLLDVPALLDSRTLHLQRIYQGTDTGHSPSDMLHVGIPVIKLTIWLVCVFAIQIIFEIRTPDFPIPWPGIVTVIGLVIIYATFYAIFVDDVSFTFYYKHSNQQELSQKVSNTTIAVSTIHISYCLVYFILEGVLEESVFVDGEWNFYISLIIAGVSLLVIVIVSLIKQTQSCKITNKNS